MDDFEVWYRASYSGVVKALLVQFGEPALAAEAASDAYVRALERWSHVSKLKSPSGWVYTVALNIARRRTRRWRLERAIVQRLRRERDPEPAWADAGDLWQVVRTLPPRQREVIAYTYLLGMGEGEVADALGIARGTVSATLTAARRSLAQRIPGRAPA